MRKLDNALEWIITGAESKAMDFVIVALVLFAIGYLAWQVAR